MKNHATAPHVLGEPIPTVCLIEDVCRILQMSRRTCERHLRAQTLRLVEIERIGRVRRFTGESVSMVKARSRWVAERRKAS